MSSHRYTEEFRNTAFKQAAWRGTRGTRLITNVWCFLTHTSPASGRIGKLILDLQPCEFLAQVPVMLHTEPEWLGAFFLQVPAVPTVKTIQPVSGRFAPRCKRLRA